MHNRTSHAVSTVVSILLLSRLVGAQDIDVPGNLTMTNSTETQGNILKNGVLFLHNFGSENTFLGGDAGNLTMSGSDNTAVGTVALQSNTSGDWNTAVGVLALFSNTEGQVNTAIGYNTLSSNTVGTDNTAVGFNVLSTNTDGSFNTASGVGALRFSTGSNNTAAGYRALFGNANGSFNTAFGYGADVASGELTNATAIGANAVVDDNNKIRLGDAQVTVIEGEVPFTYTSDRNKKENFQPVNGEEVLTKIAALSLSSWNYVGQNAKVFRHYGPMAQDFFAAFGHDAVGTIGTDTTLNSGDLDGIMMVALQALEKRTVEQEALIGRLTAKNVDLEARVAALERRISPWR